MSSVVICMNIYYYKKIISAIFIGFFVFLIGHQQIQAQQENSLSFNDILSKLTSASRINKNAKESNEQLITDVRKRGINFDLTLKNKNSLRKVGGSDFLIKVIGENSPKYIKEKAILYRKFTDNYDGTIAQKQIALEAAKEFIFRYNNDQATDTKDVIKYFRHVIPVFQKMMAKHEDCKCN
ncbi:MAG: hypothetical protein WKF71_14155 [Pyrinomonadaceae bacterium]